MERFKSVGGYAFAILSLIAAVLTPFVLVPYFTGGVVAMGIRRDPAYSGGDVDRTVDRGSYKIEIFKPVHRMAPLQEMDPFIQVALGPANELPARLSEELDLDGDGKPDLAVSFDVTPDPKAALSAKVVPMSPLIKPIDHLAKESFCALIARVEDKVVLRLPLASQKVAEEKNL